MKKIQIKRISKDNIISAAIVLAILSIASICFDILFHYNDDVMIESIVSGSFSGKTSYLSYYFSVPLAFIISFLYRFFPNINFLGIFFMSVYVFGLYFILYEVCKFKNDKKSKAYLIMLSVITAFATIFSGMILIHYTVVSAFAGGVGIFILIVEDKKMNYKAIIFMLVSYMIRTKVFFMAIPFFVVALIYKLCENGIKNAFHGIKNFIKMLMIFATLFLIIMIINTLPYSSGQMKEYAECNDARTKLYDYVLVRDSDEAMTFYKDCGISEKEIELYRSYNIMLSGDEAYRDIKNMGDFDESQNGKTQKLKNALYLYKMSIFDREQFFPYNYIIIGLYFVLMLLSLKHGKLEGVLGVVGAFFVKSCISVYLFYGGRTPERVTFSLLLLEIMLLLAIILKISEKEKNYSLSKFIPMVMMLIMLFGAYKSLGKLSDDYSNQQSVNKNDDVIYSYMADNEDKFFFIDLYATVIHTSPMFKDYSSSPDNYMILGGWMWKHPLVEDKLKYFGLSENVPKALFEDNAYLVTKENVGWQKEDYENYFEGAKLDLVDTVVSEDDIKFYVYKCRMEKESK